MRPTTDGTCSLADVKRAAPPGSLELASYIRSVYGANAGNVSFDWDRVDVVWLQHLSQLRPPCRQPSAWPRSPWGQKAAFVPGDASRPANTVWVYPHARFCACCGMARSAAAYADDHCRAESGVDQQRSSAITPARPAAVELLGGGLWVEVSHVFVRGQHNVFERDALYMYRASGSGLWYELGKTLVAHDTIDAARRLNLTLADGWADVDDARGLNGASNFVGRARVGKGQLLGKLRRRGYETLLLTHHLDSDAFFFRRPRADDGERGARTRPAAGRAFYKIEVVGLRPHARFSCPPDAEHLAWGSAGGGLRQPCACAPNGPSQDLAFCHLGRTLAFPYRHVECDRGAAATASGSRALRTGAGGVPSPCVRRSVTLSSLAFHLVQCGSAVGTALVPPSGSPAPRSPRARSSGKGAKHHHASRATPSAALPRILQARGCNYTRCSVDKRDGEWPTDGGCPFGVASTRT